MKKLSRTLALWLIGAMLLSSCSMLTANGRRQASYERYVRKNSLGRVKQQKRMSYHKTTMPVLQPTEPAVATEVSEPESVGRSDGGGQ